jgi:NADPH:quinone reductase-like Zn-dependent oxidoreductase
MLTVVKGTYHPNLRLPFTPLSDGVGDVVAVGARVLQLGASEGINYKTTPEWGDRAREFTGGWGVDHIVEVGGYGNCASKGARSWLR